MASEVDIQLKNPFTLQNVGPSQELFSWEYSGVGGGGWRGLGSKGKGYKIVIGITEYFISLFIGLTINTVPTYTFQV